MTETKSPRFDFVPVTSKRGVIILRYYFTELYYTSGDRAQIKNMADLTSQFPYFHGAIHCLRLMFKFG